MIDPKIKKAIADATRVSKTETQKNIEYHGHGLDRELYGNTFGDRTKASKTHDPDNSQLAQWMLDPTHQKRVEATKDSVRWAGVKMAAKLGLKSVRSK